MKYYDIYAIVWKLTWVDTVAEERDPNVSIVTSNIITQTEVLPHKSATADHWAIRCFFSLKCLNDNTGYIYIHSTQTKMMMMMKNREDYQSLYTPRESN